jgi:hypothetical protein
VRAFGPKSDLFFKFDLGACQEVLARSRFTLWDCPCAIVFVDVEGPAGMRQQNFQFVFPAPEHQQTSADSTSFGFRVFLHLVILCGNLISAFCQKTRPYLFLSRHR